MTYLTDIEQTLQKFLWNHKQPRITSAILRKKNKVGGITIPDIKLYYKAGVIKPFWYCHTTETDKLSRTESPGIIPCQCGWLTFDLQGSNVKQNKSSLFNKWCWEIWTVMCK